MRAIFTERRDGPAMPAEKRRDRYVAFEVSDPRRGREAVAAFHVAVASWPQRVRMSRSLRSTLRTTQPSFSAISLLLYASIFQTATLRRSGSPSRESNRWKPVQGEFGQEARTELKQVTVAGHLLVNLIILFPA